MRKVVFVIALVVLLAVMVFGQEETNYTNESVARLSFLEGKAYLQRAADLGSEDAVLNMPITEGDRLSAADGRVEVYLGRGNYLRLDQNTKVDFLNLPKKGYDRTRLRVWAGNVYLNINGLDKEKDIEVHTADVSVYVLEKGLYRLDIHETEGTEVLVFAGLLEAAGEDGSNMMNAGQRAELLEGRFVTRPVRFVAVADDSFDRWNQSRDDLVAKAVAERHLTGDLAPYESELDEYGRWAYLEPYGSIWIPYGVGPNWRPYYYGRWTWLPICGWTWIPYDVWGWAPFHYGRWGWDIGFGWYWIPGAYWGPAWVSWWWGMDYFGWAPLGYYGYPLAFYGGHYYDHWDGDYPHDSKVLTVIRKDQLTAPNVSKVAVSSEALRNVGAIRLTADRSIAPQGVPGSGLIQERISGDRTVLKSLGREAGTREIRRTQPQGTAARAGKVSGTSTPRKVVERSSATASGQAAQGSSASSTSRRIRKKDEGGAYYPSSRAPVGQVGSRNIVGYPSSSSITSRSPYLSRYLKLTSPLGRFYNGFKSEGSSVSSSRSRSSSYRGSSGRSSSRSSSSRSSSSRSSSSRGSSSGHSSSHSSGGGHVHRK
jgi:hypothetical protein